jgi:hypothetical protein
MANIIENLAMEWVVNAVPAIPAENYYCATRDAFQARVDNMIKEMIAVKKVSEGDAYMAGAIAGEIGNNSFDHNIGNWPDTAGIFFGYEFNGGVKIILADRGRGVMETLKRVRPEIINEQDALRVAFFEKISGRAPEARGNGLKFVRQSAKERNIRLTFVSGEAKAELNKDFSIGNADQKIHGCWAAINL